MANLAQFDIGAKQQEARIRALLEDLLEEVYIGGRPGNGLALAVWFRKSLGIREQHLFLVYGGRVVGGIASPVTVPLYWKTGSQDSPLVLIEATDVDWFLQQRSVNPQPLIRYQNDYEVLYFDKNLLPPGLLDFFHVITEPPGLMKGWYADEEEYLKSRNTGDLLAAHSATKPIFGLVKTEEKDFENCRGILHEEVSQKWTPVSPDGIRVYRYYSDFQKGRPVYFIFEGGALYQVLRFEVKTNPDYAGRFGLLGKPSNDRYPEVYLRAVRPPAQPAT
jgi:hypothetical protein